MKRKKVLSAALASVMVLSIGACSKSDSGTTTTAAKGTDAAKTTTAAGGDSSSTTAATTEAEKPVTEFKLETLKVVVDGTLTATVDNGQADFEKQWEAAVSAKLGHDIDLQIQQIDHSGYKDALGRMLLGQDMADVVLMPADMFKEYSTTGLLWDMAAAYNTAEFQERLVLKNVNESIKTSDGKLYGFAPYYGNGCVTYVKKAWLDAVGMKAEDIKTFADYEKMLEAFATKDPDGNGKDDTYGVVAAGFGKMNEAPYINYMPEFWQGSYPAVYQKDGVWVDGFDTQETKDALLRLQDAYNKKLIDPETLTASTKIAREKWFSNDQSGSSGVFTYWAGTWYQTLTDNLTKNNVDSELVMLEPIEEIKNTVGGYLNREAPVFTIIDDKDGSDDRELAVFQAFIETMLDGDTVQTLWVYGAEDVHWSTKAETFVTNAGTDKEKTYTYEEGKFHLKQSPNDPNTLWKKNLIDPALVISPFKETAKCYGAAGSELATQGNLFFLDNKVDAPTSPANATLTEYASDIMDAKEKVITTVVTQNGDVDAAMDEYRSTVGAIITQALEELNAG